MNSSSTPAQLLRTKLFIPQPHPELVQREHLLKRLDSAWEVPLTVIWAPAGFGKSTLVASWATRQKLPVAWVSLDERESDPVYFWLYFIAAIQNLAPQIGEDARDMLLALQAPAIDTILTTLINDLTEVDSDLILILDDYHTISDPQIHAGLTFFLESIGSGFHLMVVSRMEPPLDLYRFRARRHLAELNQTDLRFSNADIDVFFNNLMELRLSTAQIAQIGNLTEGWAVGLQLAAISLRSVADPVRFIQTFGGDDRYIFDYLAQEVLQHQPDYIRRFLLESSILERFCAPLCIAFISQFTHVTQGEASSHEHIKTAQQIIEEIEQANLFLIPLDNQRAWYRYHHLFAEFLRTRLEQEYPETDRLALYEKAAGWCLENGWLQEGLELTLAMHDYERAAELIYDLATEMFVTSQLTLLRDWLNRFPGGFIQKKPRLIMTLAWVHLATNRHKLIEPLLQQAETALGYVADGSPQSLSAPRHIRDALGEIACVRSNLQFHTLDLPSVLEHSNIASAYLENANPGDMALYQLVSSIQSVITFNQALVYENTGDSTRSIDLYLATIRIASRENNFHLWTMAESHLANIFRSAGDLHQARRHYEGALNVSSRSDAPKTPMLALAHAGLGCLYYEWNHLERARQHVDLAIEQATKWANWEALLPANVCLADILTALGDHKAGLQVHIDLTALAEKLEVIHPGPMLHPGYYRIQARMGNFEEARDWTASSDLLEVETIPYHRFDECLDLISVLIVDKHPDKAAALIRRLRPLLEATNQQGKLIRLTALESLAWYAKGEQRAALESLERSLELAAPQDYMRLFLDEGALMHQLLAAYQGSQKWFSQKLLNAFQQTQISSKAASPHESTEGQQYLSERELEVLRLLEKGLSNKEIADTLVISLNTVKSHTKNIYAQLDVKNRTQAVAQARKLSIL